VYVERGFDAGHQIGGENCRPVPSGRSPATREGIAERRTAGKDGSGVAIGSEKER